MEKKHQQLLGILGVQRVKTDETLARYTTFKIGGSADMFYEAHTCEELVYAVTQARRLGVSVFVLGSGSNILIGDKGIRGLVVKNATDRVMIRAARGSLHRGKQDGHVFIEADSGVLFNKLVRFTIEEGLGGLEMHLGLPGTVGGALFTNSKWMHPSAYVGDVVHQAVILTRKGDLTTVPRSYFHFGYDTSVLQKSGDIVISVVFALTPKSKEELWDIANESIAYRRLNQPLGVFSPGCTFRNITKAQALSVPTPGTTTSAGFLIDHAGLKDARQGDAQISAVHANFIVNRGQATASDVVKLIDRAKEQVKRKFGVTLEEEIVRVGEF